MSDRQQLKRAEARELYRHWALTKDRKYLDARFKVVDRLYGPGAQQEIRAMMHDIKEGRAE